jgi:hypothetical protein
MTAHCLIQGDSYTTQMTAHCLIQGDQCNCLSEHVNHNMGFQGHMMCSFCIQWVQLRWEVLVRFVDIGGIDDHHCLKSLIY